MALPFSMPSAKDMRFMHNFFSNPKNSKDIMLLKQQLLLNIAYPHMNRVEYTSPHGYDRSLPPGPYLQNVQPNGASQQPMYLPMYSIPYPSPVPTLSLIPTPAPVLTQAYIPTPQEYFPGLESKQSYLSQLKAAADRLAKSDAQSIADTFIDVETESVSEIIPFENTTYDSASDVIVVTDNVPHFRTLSEDLPPTPESVLEQRYGVGNEPALTQDHSLRQRNVLPSVYEFGQDQDISTKVESQVKYNSDNYPKPTKKERKTRSKQGSEVQKLEDTVLVKPSGSREREKKEKGNTFSRDLRTLPSIPTPAPVPTQAYIPSAREYFPGLKSKQSYRSQFKSAANWLAESDAQSIADSFIDVETESVSEIIPFENTICDRETDVIVVTDNVPHFRTLSDDLPPTPESVVGQRYGVENSIGQQNVLPSVFEFGKDQDIFTKVEAQVEDNSANYPEHTKKESKTRSKKGSEVQILEETVLVKPSASIESEKKEKGNTLSKDVPTLPPIPTPAPVPTQSYILSAQEYFPGLKSKQSYMSQLKSAANWLPELDAQSIADSFIDVETESVSEIMPFENTTYDSASDFIVVTDNVPHFRTLSDDLPPTPESVLGQRYGVENELVLAQDHSLGQQNVLPSVYEFGQDQDIFTNVEAQVEDNSANYPEHTKKESKTRSKKGSEVQLLEETVLVKPSASIESEKKEKGNTFSKDVSTLPPIPTPAPVPTQAYIPSPQEYFSGLESKQSYLSQLKSAENWLAESDAQSIADTFIDVETESVSDIIPFENTTYNSASDVIVVTGDVRHFRTLSDDLPSTSESVLEQRYGVENELVLAQDHSLGQQNVLPSVYEFGQDQDISAKVEAQVEDNSANYPEHTKKESKTRSKKGSEVQILEETVLVKPSVSIESEKKEKGNTFSKDIPTLPPIPTQAPVPTQAYIPSPQEYFSGLESKQSYLSQLKSAENWLAESDAQSIADTFIDVETESVSDIIPFENTTYNSASDVIVVTGDVRHFRTLSDDLPSTPESVLEQRYGVGNELALTQDHSLGQQNVLPSVYEFGKDQDISTTIRAQVEDNSANYPEHTKKESKTRSKKSSEVRMLEDTVLVTPSASIESEKKEKGNTFSKDVQTQAPALIPTYIPTPQEYFSGLESKQSYLSQLKSAANRLAESDAQSIAVTETTPFENTGAMTYNSASDVIVVTDNTTYFRALSEDLPPIPESVLERRCRGGNELALTQDTSLGQQNVLPSVYKFGQEQDSSTKIEAQVEDNSFNYPQYTKKESKVNSKKGSEVQILEDIVLVEPSASIESEKKEVRNSFSKDRELIARALRSEWYPIPVSTTLTYLIIGSNGTFVPASFYETIPWESTNESIRFLTEFFLDSSRSTTNLYGQTPLDAKMIDDIVSLVSYKCSVTESYIRHMISDVCAAKAQSAKTK